MSEREKDIARIANMYTKYLNGPLGSGVMDHLQEGESFTIKPYDKEVEIHKLQGKAVVKVLDSIIAPDTE
ncbi:MAG: hypothetical protein RTV41_05525 [Candidatus Thorarchaeota archaeon]